MSTDKNFWNLYPLFMECPPTIIDPTTEQVVRHGGGTTRCSFWAGYDGVIRGPHLGQPGSVARSAWRAGRDYRKLVNSGKREPLPDANSDKFILRMKTQ